MVKQPITIFRWLCERKELAAHEEENMPNEAGIVAGQKGETVFAEPFIDYHWSANELPSFMQRAYATRDDRSFVVFSFVVIEKYLDTLLEAIAPGYKALKDNRDFTASLKIEMLKALRLVPGRILQAIDMARKIRNEFAHGEGDRLEQLPSKFRDPAANLVRLIFGDQPTYVSSLRETFKALVFFVLTGLQAYRPNFLILREKLDDFALTEELKLECHKRFMEGVALRTKREPLRIEEKEGWRYSFYEDGLVSITAADPNDPPNLRVRPLYQIRVYQECCLESKRPSLRHQANSFGWAPRD